MVVDEAFLDYGLYECHGCGEMIDLATQRLTWVAVGPAILALVAVVL